MASLLFFGLLFPIISWLTTIGCYYKWLKYKKHSSAIYIPFIGPVLLTIWVCGAEKPWWLIPIVWICDIGTVSFIYVIPRLISDWWKHR